MKAYILIGLIMLIAPMAGAYELTEYRLHSTCNNIKFCKEHSHDICQNNGENCVYPESAILCGKDQNKEIIRYLICQYDFEGNLIQALGAYNYHCPKKAAKDQPAEEAKDCVSIPDGLCDKQSDAEKWREKCDFWLNLADTKKTTPNNYAWFADRSIPYCTRYNAALLNEIRENQK